MTDVAPDHDIVVQSGDIAAIRLFTAAYAIDLARAEALVGASEPGASARVKLDAAPAKAIAFVDPPLAVALGEVAMIVAGTAVTMIASARLYDFGVVALALRLPVGGIDWARYATLVDAVDAAVGEIGDGGAWDTLRERVAGLVGGAYVRPNDDPLVEDYLIAMVDRFDRSMTSEALLASVDLVPILAGHDRPLSTGARAEVLRRRFSYYTDDLAVIGWDRAFLFEPRREEDVADILELANAQLVEMRDYDRLLNQEVPRLGALLDRPGGRLRPFASRHYARNARRLRALVAEITELTERVDNALLVTEDVYLARVHAAAIDLLRVTRVGDAVDAKLAIIRETYAALQAEADGARSELLEITVVLLIASEIALTLLRR